VCAQDRVDEGILAGIGHPGEDDMQIVARSFEVDMAAWAMSCIMHHNQHTPAFCD
jgi:hypothetical protein